MGESALSDTKTTLFIVLIGKAPLASDTAIVLGRPCPAVSARARREAEQTGNARHTAPELESALGRVQQSAVAPVSECENAGMADQTVKVVFS
jgi:hypothetical protein